MVFYKRLQSGEKFENPRAFLYRTLDNIVKKQKSKSISSNYKHKKIAKIFRITVAACAVIAIFTTANKVTENVTGQSLVSHASEAVQEMFNGKTVKANTITTEIAQSTVTTTEAISEETTTNEIPEEKTTNKQEEVATQSPKK